MYHKLTLDHAREWYRAAESIQEDQIHVKDQIHSNRGQTDSPAIPNMVRDCVQENSLENIHQTLPK